MLELPLDLSRTRAVVLDVDGTIAGSDHRVADRTIRAMRELDRAGLAVMLATGRSRSNVLDLSREAELRAPQISCNGGVTTDPVSGEDLRVRTMDPVEVRAMVTLHERTGQDFTWWTADGIYVTTPALQRTLLAFNDSDVVLASPDQLDETAVLKAMVWGTKAQLDAISPDVSELVPRATRSMDEFWEISAPDASKWAAVAFVLDRLGIDPALVAGAGDGGNDAVWMEQVGAPVAMGNARPEAIAAARAQIGHHDEDGAAEFLEEIARQIGCPVG